MNERTEEEQAKNLLSPESANITTLEKLVKRQRHDSLHITDDLQQNQK